MADEPLTRPERAAEIGLARRKMASVLRAGGCGVCKHAVHGWGKSACSVVGQVFPRCVNVRAPRIQFELDETKLSGEN